MTPLEWLLLVYAVVMTLIAAGLYRVAVRLRRLVREMLDGWQSSLDSLREAAIYAAVLEAALQRSGVVIPETDNPSDTKGLVN